MASTKPRTHSRRATRAAITRANLFAYIIFSTKHRQPLLTDATLRAELHAYLAGTCKNLDSPAVIIGGVADHVHILSRLSRTHAVAELVRELKRESSKWCKEKSTDLAGFYWQDGYGAFSASPGHVEALKLYIANQEEHHRRETFQDEFRRVLRKYGLEWDERYVWD
jgi:putative transposase